MNKHPGIIFLFLVITLNLKGQARNDVDTSLKTVPISYGRFLSMVSTNNLSYAAEKFNIDMARANVEAARIFPDPNLSFTWIDNGQQRMKSGYGFNTSVNWLIELGGKRKARTQLALSRLEVVDYMVSDYFRNLRADATLSYLETVLQENLLKISRESYESMAQLAKADSIRFKLGTIREIDARQSKLEAGTMLNTVFQKEANWKAALVNIRGLLGKSTDSLFTPLPVDSKFDRSFELHDLVQTAIANRADMMAALKTKEVSQNMLQLAQANRAIDVGLNMGITNNAAILNKVSPTPSTSVIAAGITIPLKFSGKYKAELLNAKYAVLQTDLQYKQAEIQVQSEVTIAYHNYIAARKQVQQFNKGMLEEARKAMEAKVYSYQSGESDLLEVLNAQRTYNSVRQSYYEAVNQFATTLVEMERAAGIWDINL